MKFKWIALLLAGLLCVASFSPWLFVQVATWQREFNQLISENLYQIQQHSITAGMGLIAASFAYGALHALGPGHGKFIIASYLSTHESKLLASLRLSLFSSLMQGIVAISATTVLVVILNLSSRYFKLSELWLERSALFLLILLGLYWLWQGIKGVKKNRTTFNIRSIEARNLHQSAVIFPNIFHSQDCACGHQHLPTGKQLQQAATWHSQLLVVLSIGMRPCSGAIFVLFLAYMLNLYWWGIWAVLAMSLGTGLVLSSIALIVRYARQSAVKLGQLYGATTWQGKGSKWIKILAGSLMIFLALSLLYGTTLPVSGGAVMFK